LCWSGDCSSSFRSWTLCWCARQRHDRLWLKFCTVRRIFLSVIKENQNIVTKKFKIWILFCVLQKDWILVNINFTLEQAMKSQRGSRGIALLFL
jgi:hypothetical protein